MTTRHAMLIGATSGLSTALARQLAADGWALSVSGRDTTALEKLTTDLTLRGAPQVGHFTYDATQTNITAQWNECIAARGPITLFVVLIGAMGNPPEAALTAENIAQVTQVNFTAPAILLSHAANAMDEGTLVAVSSVAGDRGRASVIVYGSAKAALTNFTGALRQRLNGSKLNILTVKPGPMDTAMTRGLDAPLKCAPDVVAKAIVQAIAKRRRVLYAPTAWLVIMTIIRLIPEHLFMRTKI